MPAPWEQGYQISTNVAAPEKAAGPAPWEDGYQIGGAVPAASEVQEMGLLEEAGNAMGRGWNRLQQGANVPLGQVLVERGERSRASGRVLR